MSNAKSMFLMFLSTGRFRFSDLFSGNQKLKNEKWRSSQYCRLNPTCESIQTRTNLVGASQCSSVETHHSVEILLTAAGKFKAQNNTDQENLLAEKFLNFHYIC